MHFRVMAVVARRGTCLALCESWPEWQACLEAFFPFPFGKHLRSNLYMSSVMSFLRMVASNIMMSIGFSPAEIIVAV